jgi:cysteine desulfuration protein SufE
MLLRIYSGRTPTEVLATDAAAFLKELDLIGNLSANRGNGIAAMVARIRAIAAGAAAAA